VQRLGLEKKLTRQFRTMLSRPPGTTPPLNDEVRVLVIADPAPALRTTAPRTPRFTRASAVRRPVAAAVRRRAVPAAAAHA